MKATSAFDILYRRLNKLQRETVDAIEGPVMVIAGPGTGKTDILTLRIANILAKTDTSPEAVLALTFTESGASEMKRRLADIIGTDAYRVTVTTFHSFCNEIIQKYSESFGALAGAAPVSEADQAVIVDGLIESTKGLELLRPVNAPDLYLKAVLHAINTLKREGVDSARLAEMAETEKTGILNAPDLHHTKGAYKGKIKGNYQEELKLAAKNRELAILYGAYQAALRKQRLYDYNDMVMEVARTLSTDEQLRLMLQEQHQYILVDEHQDTNNAQNRVIEHLASFFERPNLFVVGDANQAIYRFQGASLQNFLYFREIYKTVRVIPLDQNYRSSQLLLDAAHSIRSSGTNALHAKSGNPDTPIELRSYSSPDLQYWAVADDIKHRVAAGEFPEDIAILARDNADAVSVAEFLERLGIPFSLSSQQDAFDDPYLSQLILIFNAVRDFGHPALLIAALHAPVLAIEPLDIYKLIEFCRHGRNPYDLMRSAALMHEAGIEDGVRFQQLSAQLASWSRLSRQPSAAQAMETIVRESGLLAAMVADASAPDILAKLHALYDMVRAHVQRNRRLTLSDFAAHLQFLRGIGVSVSAGTGSVVPGRVRVMTAHKSKGLEFDSVYIIDGVDSRWGVRTHRGLLRLPDAVFIQGGETSNTAERPDDEERNLFYVALTRARKRVIITMSNHSRNGREELPARFITDIRPELIRRIDVSETEARWTRERAVRFAAPVAVLPRSEDKSYLNDLFSRQGMSVTALNNYLSCPWEYFYKNLLRIPEAQSVAMMFGNAVDSALTDYFDRLAQGNRGSKEDLVSAFAGYLRHQPLQSRDLAAALKRGRKALLGYFEKYHASWNRNVINQLRIPAVVLDGVTLNGKIDKIELLQTPHVLVTDYKTGKSKSRNQILGAVKDGDGNYFRQLAFYKLLLDRWQDGRYHMVRGVIDFVEPDDSGKWRREEFEVTPGHVVDLETVIRRVAGEIRELSFWSRHCDNRDCAYCRLSDIMVRKTVPR